MRHLRIFSLALLAGMLLLASTACAKLKARDHINQGAAAFKSARYSDAVEHFKLAMELDPQLPTAHQYLAISYMVQWIPGAESPENLAVLEKARTEFDKLLVKDPNDRTSLAYMAYMAYNQAASLPAEQKLAKYDEATKTYLRLIATDPESKENREAFYTMGVIAYNRWKPALMLARSNLRMRVEDPGPIKDKKVKEALRTEYSAVIQGGIDNLDKALSIDPEYDEAMAYKNLMIRTRADLLDGSDEYTRQIKDADDWLQKALDTKKMKVARQEKSAAGGIINDVK